MKEWRTMFIVCYLLLCLKLMCIVARVYVLEKIVVDVELKTISLVEFKCKILILSQMYFLLLTYFIFFFLFSLFHFFPMLAWIIDLLLLTSGIQRKEKGTLVFKYFSFL